MAREAVLEFWGWKEHGIKKRAGRLRYTLDLGEPQRLPVVL